MSALDLVVVLLVAAVALGGAARGLGEELLTLLAWLAVVVAIRFGHGPASALIGGWISGPTAPPLLALCLLLLLPIALFSMALARVRRGRAPRRPHWIDRLLGFGFGIVRGVVIATIGFAVVVLAYDPAWQDRGRPAWLVDARIYPLLDAASRAMVPMIEERRAYLRSGRM